MLSKLVQPQSKSSITCTYYLCCWSSYITPSDCWLRRTLRYSDVPTALSFIDT